MYINSSSFLLFAVVTFYRNHYSDKFFKDADIKDCSHIWKCTGFNSTNTVQFNESCLEQIAF